FLFETFPAAQLFVGATMSEVFTLAPPVLRLLRSWAVFTLFPALVRSGGRSMMRVRGWSSRVVTAYRRGNSIAWRSSAVSAWGSYNPWVEHGWPSSRRGITAQIPGRRNVARHSR